MRSEREMLDLILAVARDDERIRLVSMNGSRTNPKAPKDPYQDYDVVYAVTDMPPFLSSPHWVDVFGPRIILQTPEAMSLFPPELGKRFTYLMLLEDGNRIDLMLLPLAELDAYLHEDRLLILLLDKDGRAPSLPPPSDESHWVRPPSPADFNDCCNEFWWLSAYVAKGLCRQEPTYAAHHLAMMRRMLFIMLSWELAAMHDFSITMGKEWKYMPRYLDAERWSALMDSYDNAGEAAIRRSLFLCCRLFRESSRATGRTLNFTYPDYDAKVSPYIENLLENCGQ